MTKRAKLSLDPARQAKGEPRHGFGDEMETGDAVPETPPAPPPEPTPRPAAGAWQADRPKSADSTAAAASAATRSPPEPARKTMPRTLPPQLATLAKHPLVRMLALGVAAGLSFYLLKRRL
jgi:hypothetical protein